MGWIKGLTAQLASVLQATYFDPAHNGAFSLNL